MKSKENKNHRDIRERVFEYALRAVKLYRSLQEKKDGAGKILGKQYLRSATSIGANIEEAQAAESKADFKHKCCIASKEARESLYRLRLINKSNIIPENLLTPLIQETDELIAIITTIIVNTSKRDIL
jgi:four helix bundle protein